MNRSSLTVTPAPQPAPTLGQIAKHIRETAGDCVASNNGCHKVKPNTSFCCLCGAR